MAIELNFSKPDSSSHWGFRLVGGADFNEPLVVVKVNENGFAEVAGLMVGDVVVRVNNTATAGLTHADAHELINSAGCQFVMAIRRGLFSDLPVPSVEDNNIEIEDILNKSLAEHLGDLEKDHQIGTSPTILENLAGQEQLIEGTKSKTLRGNERVNKPKKYSSFLVKPRNPKPVVKKEEEERKILGDPYRVKIIKQPRRDPKDVINNKKSVQFEPNVIEISRDTSIADSMESEVSHENDVEIEVSMQVSEETTVEIRDADDEVELDENFDTVDNSYLDEDNIIEDNEITIKKQKPVLKAVPSLDIHIDPVVCESSLSLEQQLAAVQKQLLALSQLPSAIQVTLEAVTQQLNQIVLEKSILQEEIICEENGVHSDENEYRSDGTIEDDGDENVSVSENAEGDITENETEDQHNFDDLENDQVCNEEEEEATVKEEDTDPAQEGPERHIEVDPYAGLTEEEIEAKNREERLLAKKQKIEEERRKMDWTQRPIVLPGGRKWSDPDDATPKKPPKMSDEKICRAIEENSEVIVGKTKGSTIGTQFGHGEKKRNPSTVPESQTVTWFPVRWKVKFINFLKFTPPPKNLDYLQRSEVYRLIHDMEPPSRGVGARAEKILSETDYYGDKGAP